MFFSKSFEAIINQLSDKISAQNHRERDYLDSSICEWCNYLDFSEAAQDYINRGFKKQGIQPKSGPDYRNTDSPCISLGDNQIKIHNIVNFIDSLNKSIRWRDHAVKFYLLFAFVIVSVGYVLFLLSKRYEEQSYQARGNQLAPFNVSHPEFAQPIKHDFLLILVVNVKHEGIINTLRSTGSITPDMTDQLYHATQELWFGSEKQYLNSPVQSSFKSKEAFAPSEYDVYFVKIKLSQKDSGFEEKASQLSRVGGFRQLPRIAQEVEVSNRLSSKSYENIGVYSR